MQIEDDDNNDDNDCPDDYDSAAEDSTMFKAKVVSNLSTFDRMEFFSFLNCCYLIYICPNTPLLCKRASLHCTFLMVSVALMNLL